MSFYINIVLIWWLDIEIYIAVRVYYRYILAFGFFLCVCFCHWFRIFAYLTSWVVILYLERGYLSYKCHLLCSKVWMGWLDHCRSFKDGHRDWSAEWPLTWAGTITATGSGQSIPTSGWVTYRTEIFLGVLQLSIFLGNYCVVHKDALLYFSIKMFKVS